MANLELLWEELAQGIPAGATYRIRSISPDTKHKIFAGILFPQGYKCLLFSIGDPAIRPTPLKREFSDFRYEISTVDANNPQRITVELKNEILKELFAVLCGDLIRIAESEHSESEAISRVIRRLNDWERLFKAAKAEGLSPAQQTGLFGELWILREIIKNDTPLDKAVLSWVGCEGEAHDFQLGVAGIEIKTTASGDEDTISVSNEFQLDKGHLENLYLCVLNLSVINQNGMTLVKLIADIRDLLKVNTEVLTDLNNKLIRVGYFDHHYQYYQERGYFVDRIRGYIINSEFPKITRASIPDSVTHVKYNLNLSHLDNFQTEYRNMLKEIN